MWFLVCISYIEMSIVFNAKTRHFICMESGLENSFRFLVFFFIDTLKREIGKYLGYWVCQSRILFSYLSCPKSIKVAFNFVRSRNISYISSDIEIQGPYSSCHEKCKFDVLDGGFSSSCESDFQEPLRKMLSFLVASFISILKFLLLFKGDFSSQHVSAVILT